MDILLYVLRIPSFYDHLSNSGAFHFCLVAILYEDISEILGLHIL